MSARQKTGHDPRKTCLRCCHQRHCLPNTPGARGCGPRLVRKVSRTLPAECVPSLRCQTSAPRSKEQQHESSFQTSRKNGGARRDRTDDLLNANQALSQLSYGPVENIPDDPGGPGTTRTSDLTLIRG